MIRICCTGYEAENKSTEWVTSGMIGAVCEFTFDDAWDGLYKTAVFRAGDTVRDVLLTGNRCTIPWEVLAEPWLDLEVGVYGANAAGTLVIPTMYANCGKIHPGADPSGEESTDPTLPVWAQLQAQIGDLDELETSAKDNLIDAINEAAQSGGHTGGGGSGESSTIDIHTQALSPTFAHENGGTQVDFDVETGGAISRTSVQLWNGNDGSGGGASSAGDVSVSDAGEYFTAGTVEGALQEIGAELSGINTLIGTGVIV